jgi:hypothetical protein
MSGFGRGRARADARRGEGDGELEILVGFWLLNTPVLERPIHPNREHRSQQGPDQGGIVQ